MSVDIGSLIATNNWLGFVESVAEALQLNLIFYVRNQRKCYSYNEVCPRCGEKLPGFNFSGDFSDLERLADTPDIIANYDNIRVEAFKLKHNILVIARKYRCCNHEPTFSFHDRVIHAKDLLDVFLSVLVNKKSDNGYAMELSALRQMNQIIISVFRGENSAASHALKLLLSATKIIFNADTVWLSYKLGEKEFLLSKGDYNIKNKKDVISFKINSSVITGKLCIKCPGNREQVEKLIDLIIQECIIIFEIDYLINLMETKLNSFIGIIESLVMLVDNRMNICYANKYAEELLCCKSSELLGRNINTIEAPFSSWINNGLDKAVNGIKDVLKSSKNEKYIDWVIYPLSKNVDVSGWLIIADDRTNFYRLQEIGEEAEKMVSSSVMVSVLAHEIRNPLATFKSLLELIKLKKDSEDISRYIDIGLKEINRVTLLLNQYILMGKPLNMTIEPINIKLLLEEVVEIISPEFERTKTALETHFSEVPFIQIDPIQISQVIINLLKNAIEAADKGKVKISLSEVSKDWIRILISNHGKGIPDDTKGKIFEPFYTTKNDGVGLGLAVSKAIVNKHGGEIEVENLPEGGTVFSVLLPLKEDMGTGLYKTDIMLISSDEMLRIPLEQVLRAENISYVSAYAKETAYFMLKHYIPSIVFTDCTAFTAEDCQKIKSRYPDVKILITGKKNKQLKHSCKIGLPINYAKFVNTVRSLL